MSFGSISVYFGTVIDLNGYKIEMEYPPVFVLECMFNVTGSFIRKFLY